MRTGLKPSYSKWSFWDWKWLGARKRPYAPSGIAQEIRKSTEQKFQCCHCLKSLRRTILSPQANTDYIWGISSSCIFGTTTHILDVNISAQIACFISSAPELLAQNKYRTSNKRNCSTPTKVGGKQWLYLHSIDRKQTKYCCVQNIQKWGNTSS